jgi:L-histidine Nalpha-methyltransferase
VQQLFPIVIHESQLPARTRADLVASLRRGELNPKFLYESPAQTRRWLALHQAYSPSRTDHGCQAAYDAAFGSVAGKLGKSHVHLVGLGCGGGKKDARLLDLLSQAGAPVHYTPVDVSPSLVLEATQTAAARSGARISPGVVCDLGQIQDLASVLKAARPAEAPTRLLVTFFGMIPNFEPAQIMPALAGLVSGPQDMLLFSANLAPGTDYQAGVEKVLPLYDNHLTQEWLLGYLSEIGIAPEDGHLAFGIETDLASGLKRITARFHFQKSVRIEIDGQQVLFASGSSLRVFFSYRHTCDTVERLLREHKLHVAQTWAAPSDEEGVFLAQANGE